MVLRICGFEKKKKRTRKQNKNQHLEREREQRDGYKKGGHGRMGERGKGNIVNNIVTSLHGTDGD